MLGNQSQSLLTVIFIINLYHKYMDKHGLKEIKCDSVYMNITRYSIF